MLLDAEAMALALLALVAFSMAGRHTLRIYRRGGADVRVLVAACTFSAYCLVDFADQAYWAYARSMGMPPELVFGVGPLLLKVAAALFVYAPIIWLYSERRPLLLAVSGPLVCFLLAVAIMC